MSSLPSSSSRTAFTHLLTFLAGVVVGKAIDADELAAYRSSNDDDVWTKVRRRLKSIAAGTVILTLVVKVGSRALLGDGKESGGRDGGGGGVGGGSVR